MLKWAICISCVFVSILSGEVYNYRDFSDFAGLWLQEKPVVIMAYDSSAVAAILGGFGTGTGGAWPPVKDNTYVDTVNTIASDGTITQLKLTCYSSTVTPATSCKLKLLRIDGSNYDVIQDLDVTTEFNALPHNTVTDLTISVSWSCLKDDLLAVYLADTDASRGIYSYAHTGGNMKSLTVAGDVTATTAIADFDDSADVALQFEATGTTTEFLMTDHDSGPYSDGQVFPLTATTGAEPYYIIFEDVIVSNGDALSVELQYTAANSTPTSDRKIVIDFTGADGADNIQMTTSTDVTVGDAHTTAGSSFGDQGFTFLLWIDPAGSDSNLNEQLFYTNYDKGQGTTGGDQDVSMINYEARQQNTTDERFIRVLLNQTTGTGATVGRIVTCRKPILAIGDSYVSIYSGGVTSLNHVGDKLGSAFTQTRYVINGGITGSRLIQDIATTSTQIRTRWNQHEAATEDNTNNDYHLFYDVIVVFVNGPCINDVTTEVTSSSTDAEIGALSQRLASDIGRMVGESAYNDTDLNNLGGANDTIMVGLCPNTVGDAATNAKVQLCLDKINTLLREQAAVAELLFVDCSDMAGYLDDGTHLTSAGDTIVANRVGDMYEAGDVAVSATIGDFTTTSRFR